MNTDPTPLYVAAPDRDRRTSRYGLSILMGLQGKEFYGGTVPHGVKAERRKKNRAARTSRQINRRRGA